MTEGGFFSFSGASGGDQNAKKNAIMEEIRGQIAVANAQELINNMNKLCYANCVPKPSSELGSNEKSCLSRCMDRYLEAFNIVSKTYVTRVSRERSAANVPVPGGSNDSTFQVS